MFSLGSLKPLLTALVLPPGGLLLLIFLAGLLARKFQRAARVAVLMCSLAMWLLACNATAYGLNRLLLTSYAPISNPALDQAQTIVVLGGGVEQFAPEYGAEELTDTAYKRLAYATLLAKRSGLPMLYAGGKGWAASDTQRKLWRAILTGNFAGWTAHHATPARTLCTPLRFCHPRVSNALRW